MTIVLSIITETLPMLFIGCVHWVQIPGVKVVLTARVEGGPFLTSYLEI